MDDSAIISDEVIPVDADAESNDKAKSNYETLIKRKQLAKRKISIFYLHFY